MVVRGILPEALVGGYNGLKYTTNNLTISETTSILLLLSQTTYFGPAEMKE